MSLVIVYTPNTLTSKGGRVREKEERNKKEEFRKETEGGKGKY